MKITTKGTNHATGLKTQDAWKESLPAPANRNILTLHAETLRLLMVGRDSAAIVWLKTHLRHMPREQLESGDGFRLMRVLNLLEHGARQQACELLDMPGRGAEAWIAAERERLKKLGVRSQWRAS